MEKLEQEIKTTEKEIKQMSKEIDELLKDEKVFRYVHLKNELEKLQAINEYNKNTLKLITQKNCNHKLVCFTSAFYKVLKYNPSFVCLNCDKILEGYLNDDQTCINEQYIYETADGVFGNKQKYIEIKYRFNKLKKQGYSIEEIEKQLQTDFNKDTDEKPKIIIRKKDIK